MSIRYDLFTDAFLNKISEYDFKDMLPVNRADIIDGYMKRAIVRFYRVCKFNLRDSANDQCRCFDVEIPEMDAIEIADIVSDGMVVQWLKPHLYKQELLVNVLNTRDFTSYSPSELLYRIGQAYKQAEADFTRRIRDYSYDVANIGDLKG